MICANITRIVRLGAPDENKTPVRCLLDASPGFKASSTKHLLPLEIASRAEFHHPDIRFAMICAHITGIV